MLIAYLLWFFLGALGAHRFYLRAYVSGAVQALLFVSGIATLLILRSQDLATAGLLIGTVPLTLLGLWWVVDAFLTNDKRLKSVTEIPILILDELLENEGSGG